jgi:hypothetical protein
VVILKGVEVTKNLKTCGLKTDGFIEKVRHWWSVSRHKKIYTEIVSVRLIGIVVILSVNRTAT